MKEKKKMKLRGLYMLTVLVFLPAGAAAAADVPEFRPRITDVTVFKDGHALVMARGPARLEDGWCRTRQVPVPILGAFWTFCPDDTLKIETVTAGLVDAQESRACLNFDEILQANTGKRAIIVEQFKDAVPLSDEGTILGILRDESRREVEVLRSLPAEYSRYGPYRPPQEVRETRENTGTTLASFVMLKTDAGVRLIARENIRGVTLADGEPVTKYAEKKQVRQIAVRVLKDGKPAQDAEVGFVYVQRGVRWIPDYRIELLDGGKARVTLQATIINELADIDNANLRLVIGVPSFLMKDDLSPMALQDAATQLGPYFAPPSYGRGSESRAGQYWSFSNALYAQVAAPQEPPPQAPGGPDIPAEGQQEDLYVYQVTGFTLGKGGRAMVTLAQVVVPYEDLYAWDVPPVPPREMLEHGNQDQQRMLAALSGARAVHRIRLTNKGGQPWTTGPATIFKAGMVLGQQLMTYTSPGNSVEVTITTATDLHTHKEESEVRRDAPVRQAGHTCVKVYLHGKLTVTNFKPQEVPLRVSRRVLGEVTDATGDGKVVVVNRLEDLSVPPDGYTWWSGWPWPWWWHTYNRVSEVTWDAKVPAGKSVTFEYDWSYTYVQ
jgi:hypothetical protein